jgi:uncharacterized protein
LSTAAWAWVAIAFALGSGAQAISGFGFALISIPLASLVLPPTDAVVAQTIAGSILSFVMAWQYRADADVPVIRRSVPAMIVGIPIGLAVVSRVNDRGLRLMVGVAVLVAATAIATGYRITSQRHGLIDSTAGLVSGVLTMTTGTTGPPLVITLAGRNASPATFRATLQAMFAVANALSLPAFALAGKITGAGVTASAIALVPTMLGRVAGERVFRRLNPDSFRKVVLVMLFLAGSVAIVKAIAG